MSKSKFSKLYCPKCKQWVYYPKGDISIRGSEITDKCGECGTILRKRKIKEKR